MITQELLEYIRGEIAKGKTREEIHRALIAGGGWSEDDLSEAFREIIPMQGVILPKEKPVEPISSSSPSPSLSSFLPSSSPSASSSPSPMRSFSPSPSYSPSSSLLKQSPFSKPASSPHRLFSFLKFLVIFIIIAGLGFGFWFYRSPIINLWNSFSSSDPSQNSTSDTEATVPASPAAVAPPVIETINCGVGTTPKLGNPSTYENDSVLACLGANALNCKNARGILQDNFFPTIFEITKSQDSCNFKLSYPADSVLTDITGRQLAGQYISCPIDIVKAIDNTKPASPKFLVPDKADFSKYASDVYFYGTLGLFAENNLDMAKIQALGCNGEYIQSMIASYAVKRTR